VQQEILNKNDDPNLRVYAVWFNMLAGDSRRGWDGARLIDTRVTHLWDEQKVVGDWYSANVTREPTTTWDFFAVYGPDAADLAKPLNSGRTIVSRSTQLKSSIEPLLSSQPRS
jgi:hypothetical protein